MRRNNQLRFGGGRYSFGRRASWALLFLLGLVASTALTAQLTNVEALTLVPGECCVSPDYDLAFARVLASGDFNGDGHQDLAIGTPRAEANGENEAGQVTILPGSAQGLDLAGEVVFTQASFGGSSSFGENFGSALVAGDFNQDGIDELAIGVPYDSPGAFASGGVWVAYTDPAQPDQMLVGDAEYWSFATTNLDGFAHAWDGFGASLAVGDFDGDGHPDLAIGVPDDNVYVPNTQVGSVTILMGRLSGLVPGGGNTFNRASGVVGSIQDHERFGYALAAADFDGDGVDELAVGAPGKIVNGIASIGSVVVLTFEVQGAGATAGVDVLSSEEWSEGNGIPGIPEEGDFYGASLAAGDFNGDGADDLVVGSSTESIGAMNLAGAIAVLEGQLVLGLEANAQLYWQSHLALEESEANERFSLAMTTGDFDRDGIDDLAIGSPRDLRLLVTNVGLVWKEIGAVHLVPGSTTFGLAFADTKTWIGTPAGAAEDWFGASLASGQFRPGGDALAIGSPQWQGPVYNSGRMTVLYSAGIFSDSFESGNTLRWSGAVQ